MNEPLPRNLQQKLDRLREIARGFGSVLVAYSGGVDSALVAYLAYQELGDRMLACIGNSPSFPAREFRAAISLAEQMGLRYRVIDTREHEDERYAANPDNRCFFCRSELFSRLQEFAINEGWSTVADGVHRDDISDHQNGIAAAKKAGVRSPLWEANLTKQDVRDLARHLGLSVWDKPAMACLSSRVPHGTPITLQLLRQIESAEDALADLGFRQVRVRHHGEVARIEVAEEELPRALELRMAMVERIRAAGYRHVTLDLNGYRSGSVVPPEITHVAPVQVSVRAATLTESSTLSPKF